MSGNDADAALKKFSEPLILAARPSQTKMPRILIALLFLLPLTARAAPADAEHIKRGYELSNEKWVLEMKLAATPQAREKLMAKRPDPMAAADGIWKEIAADLKQDWIIPYATFFIEITRTLTRTEPNGAAIPAFEKERRQIIETVSANHIRNPGIGVFAVSLIDGGDTQALPLLEKIISENPDKATQGIAALGASLLLKNLGDDPEVMKKRLSYLRQAIIESADRSVGGRSVADIASDELFLIRYLSKGRTAPALTGTDVGDRVVKLSDFRGKVVVLLFWDAKSPETDKVIGLTNQLVEKFEEKPVAVLGVTPEDITRIRELQGTKAIMWNNLCDPSEKLSAEYRISSRPSVFVIDADGVIQYTGLPGSFVELTVDALLNPAKQATE